MIAWTPILEPIHGAQAWWYLALIPLAMGLSVVYKAMRVGDMKRYWREVTVMTIQIIAAAIVMGIALNLFVQQVIPLLPVR
jgi:hypothetical protein